MTLQDVSVPVTRTAQWADRPLALLRSGIPLTLLIDLADPLGPRSEEIFGEEYAWSRVLDGAGGRRP